MALKRRNKVEPEFSLAAMIDVIFLLLMFFMLTSKFVTPNALNLQLPSSSSTTMASPSLSVSVTTKGEYYIDRTKHEKTRLQSALNSRIVASGKPLTETTITINAERGVPIEDVVFLLNIANKLKVKTILATDAEKEGE
jgi:biopolymer transport protein ExbD